MARLNDVSRPTLCGGKNSKSQNTPFSPHHRSRDAKLKVNKSIKYWKNSIETNETLRKTEIKFIFDVCLRILNI